MQKVIADSIDFSGVSEQIQQQLQEQLSQQLQAQLLHTFCSYFAAAAKQLSAAMRSYRKQQWRRCDAILEQRFKTKSHPR